MRIASLARLSFLALFLAASAAGQNTITNSGFASDLSGWATTGTASFSNEDASGNAGSGSATLASSVASGKAQVRQCVPAAAGVPYSFFFRTRQVAGSGANGYPTGAYSFFSDAACTTPIPSSADLNFGSEFRPDWERYGYVSGELPPSPAGTHSALVAVGVENRGDAPFPKALFDDVLFAPVHPETITIPASASIHGQAGTFFQTDLWLLGGSSFLDLTFTARHYCFAGQACSGAVRDLVLSARRGAQFNDVLGTLFHDFETAGAIELTYDSALGRIFALSRTYSPPLPAATKGSGLAALPASEARVRSLLLGLGNNGGNLSAGFRTNVGAFNPSPTTSATITFEVHDPSTGALIGTPVVRSAGPKEPIQVNDVFDAAGASSTVTTQAYVVVLSTIPVFSYSTVLDNQSADSVIGTGLADQATAYP